MPTFSVPEVGDLADVLKDFANAPVATVLRQVHEQTIELTVLVFFIMSFIVFMIAFALVHIYCPASSIIWLVGLWCAWKLWKGEMETMLMLRQRPIATTDTAWPRGHNDIFPKVSAAEATEEASVQSTGEQPLTASVQGAVSARSVPSQGEQPLTSPGEYFMALDDKKGYLVRIDGIDSFAKAAKLFMMNENGIVNFHFADGPYAGYGLSASGAWGLGAYKHAAGWRFTKDLGMQCCDIIDTCACKDKFVNMLENTDETIYCDDRTRTFEVRYHRREDKVGDQSAAGQILVSLSIKKRVRASSVQ